MPDLSGLLSGLLKNPEALSMLSSLLGQMPPPKPPSHQEKPPSLPANALTSSPKQENARKALLCALKPFLSPERQRAIDLVLMLQDTMELFRKDKEKKGEGYVYPSVHPE